MILSRWLGALLLLAGLAGPAAAQVPVPALHGRVTDLAGVLSESQRSALDSQLAAIEHSRGAQVAILVVPTTAPESIEQFSIRVTDQWKLGRKGVDDGVLLLLARDDRRVRIEVGRGLEGALTDAGSNRIIDQQMVPRLRSGDTAGALAAAVDAIGRVIAGEALPSPRAAPAPAPDGLHLVVLGLFVALGAGRLLRALLGALPAALLLGGGIGAGVLLVGGSALVALGTGALAFAIVLAGVGGFVVGGFGGGYSGGGMGGSPGGFGGGGGGFGGGGASGRW